MSETNISEPVGKVIVLSGSATAQSSTGERLLKIGDPVFKNDIIKTEAGSKVQIRFADNTQVSQAENSTLSIDKFVYNPDPADNSDLLLNMMKGTFRTITGEITKDSPTSFMLKSPQSTIGIRGTIVVSEVTSLYEKHGVSELTPGKILVITDNYGNVRIIKVPMKIVEFFKDKPVSEVRDMLLKELEEINEKAPLDLGEKDTPLGYTPPDDFVGGLDQGVDILGADVVPSDFGLTGNMVLFSTEGPGLLGVFDNVTEIPGYDPDSGPGDEGGDGSNENVIPGVNNFTISENQATQDETDEGNITYTFTVTRTGDTENAASLDWSVVGSGANPADADDFEGGVLPSGELFFTANEATGTITITVAGDTDFEFDENFSLVLSYPDGSGTAATSGDVTIQNDDAPISDYVVSAAETVQEETDTGDVSYTFTVTRTGDTEASASVNWSVDGTGANPAGADDFVGSILPSGTLNFEAGQTTQDITVTVSGDTDFEFDEEFSVTLSYPDPDGTIITTSANATIQNNDSPNIMLAELDGTDGFRVDGIDADDNSGRSVNNAGDVNGDGFDDFIIGAYRADPVERTDAGESYVVFGGENGIRDWEGPDSAFDLADLNGENGFRIEGINSSDDSGISVSSAGDINGDGYADLIIGANGADIYGGEVPNAGESYLVLGGSQGVNGWEIPNSVLNLDDLGYEEGFRLVGIDENDNSGWSVSNAGDVNGDGFDDLIIGAYRSAGDGNDFPGAGESYLIFGGEDGFRGRDGEAGNIYLDDLGGYSGIKIYGAEGVDQNGYSVSSAGDINSDGYDDFLIGAYLSDWFTGSTGESYLVLGGENGIQGLYVEDDSFSLGDLNGDNGFRIDGVVNSVSNAGDVNGDGFDDFILGSHDSNPNGNPNSGESYLIFGGQNGVQGWTEAASNLDLDGLDGNNGFSITGIDSGDYSGISVSSAGDMNGDGFDDLVIGAYNASPDGNLLAGESYLVFGGEFGVNGWSAANSILDLGELDGLNGFQINGVDDYDLSGYSVSSAGDVNGDGFDDLIIGASDADPDGTSNAGESYILFGGDFTYSVDELGNAESEIIIGTTGADNMIGGLGDDSMMGLGGSDVMYGGAGNDLINVSDFFRVDGGSGFDTLQTDGIVNLNLSEISNNKIQGIERIDLGFDDAANNLTLSMSDVLDISDTTNTLVINGDLNDTFNFSDGRWASSEPEASDFQGGEYPEGFDPGDYNVYTNGQATLYVDTELTNLTFTEAVVS